MQALLLVSKPNATTSQSMEELRTLVAAYGYQLRLMVIKNHGTRLDRATFDTDGITLDSETVS